MPMSRHTPTLKLGEIWVNPETDQVIEGVWDGLQHWDVDADTDEDAEESDPPEDADGGGI